jgi:hypothetical protein
MILSLKMAPINAYLLNTKIKHTKPAFGLS